MKNDDDDYDLDYQDMQNALSPDGNKFDVVCENRNHVFEISSKDIPTEETTEKKSGTET